LRINITEDAIGTPLVGNDNRSNHRVEGQAVKTDSSDTNTKVNILLLQTDCFPFAERVGLDQGMRSNETYFTYDKSILHLKMFYVQHTIKRKINHVNDLIMIFYYYKNTVIKINKFLLISKTQLSFLYSS